MTTFSGIQRLLAALLLALPCASQAQRESEISTDQTRPQPHPVERYESLWNAPLFSLPAPPEAIALPAPAATTVYRLLGMGTTAQGVELAYVQPVNGGRIEEVSRNASSGPVLLGVERTQEGKVDAVVFRRGNEVIRAVASAAPLPTGYSPSAADASSTGVGQPTPDNASNVVRVPARLRNRAVMLPK